MRIPPALCAVDGQASVAPTTNYGPPIIAALSGTVADASTNGGDTVVVQGTYFSTQVSLRCSASRPLIGTLASSITACRTS